MKKDKKSLWSLLVVFSLFVYMYGLLWADEDKIAGIQTYLWVIWTSYGMLFSGLTLGTLQVVSHRKQMAKSLAESAASKDNDADSEPEHEPGPSAARI